MKNPRHLFLVLVLPLWGYADGTPPTTPVSAVQKSAPAKNEQTGGFLDAANKKTAEIKKALDKLAGNDSPANPNNAPGEWKGKLSPSEAPIFDNDTSKTVSRARIKEVLERAEREWGDDGSNSSGLKKIGAFYNGTVDGIGPLRWKTGKVECIKWLDERGAKAGNTSKPAPGVEAILFEGGSFAGQNVQAWQMLFYQGALIEATVQFYYKDHDTLKQFRSLLSAMKAKYGGHNVEQDLRFLYLDFNVNYVDEKRQSINQDEEKHWQKLMWLDAKFAQALASSSAQPLAQWVYDNGDAISLRMSGRFNIQLNYKSKALAEEAEKYAKAKSSADKDL
jgi:hypothetical protein